MISWKSPCRGNARRLGLNTVRKAPQGKPLLITAGRAIKTPDLFPISLAIKPHPMRNGGWMKQKQRRIFARCRVIRRLEAQAVTIAPRAM
jgi:hypothetical protein